MRAALEGDQEAYRHLLMALRPWLAAYFRKRIQPQSVEDMVQETLMTLHAKRQTFDPAYPFGPWIAAIARHRWIDHMRKTLRYIETPLNEDFLADHGSADPLATHDISHLLARISPAQAQVITMVKLQEMSVEEVSRKTGHSQTSVKVMIHRGMKKMMAAVKESSYD